MISAVRLVRMLLCVSALVLGVSSVEAGITTIRIDKTEPLADGAAFGRAGAYERVTGLARGEVDPRDPRDTGIVNLDKAPRNARGLVEYEGDPRPSLEERYSTSARYASRIETVTRVLVQMRLLLPEDAERFVEAARSRRPVTP
jgi:hypothetical protein